MEKEPTEYFKKKKIIDFNIIHHEARGDPVQGTYKDYDTIKKSDLQEFPQWKKNCRRHNLQYKTRGYAC